MTGFLGAIFSFLLAKPRELTSEGEVLKRRRVKGPKAGPAASCVKGRVGEEEKSTREREGEKRGCINFDDVFIFVTFSAGFALSFCLAGKKVHVLP